MTGTDIQYAAALLREGRLVAIPTETVYGLAGNAFDEGAITDIFAVKNRPHFDPLIVHTHSLEQLRALALDMPDKAFQLAEAFMPGPLTLLLPKHPKIPDLVTAGSSLVALRLPQHPLTRQLLALLDFPLAAPSANPFGYISPTTAEHVAAQLGEKIPYILDGGPCTVGLESTIAGFDENGQVTIFRKGGIAVEAIEAVAGPVRVQAHSSSNPLAPGMLKSHYAPRVPMVVGDLQALTAQHAGKRLGILVFQYPVKGINPEQQVVLSSSGNLQEAARHLFGAMRHLDSLDIELIIAEWMPEKDLGRAINDRLRRAAAH